MQTRTKAGQLVARAHGQDFYRAVSVVAYPSRDAKDVGLSLHKPAEAHSLHSSADHKAAGLIGFFVGGHAWVAAASRTRLSIIPMRLRGLRTVSAAPGVDWNFAQALLAFFAGGVGWSWSFGHSRRQGVQRRNHQEIHYGGNDQE